MPKKTHKDSGTGSARTQEHQRAGAYTVHNRDSSKASGIRSAVMDIAKKTLDKHEETWKELAKH